MTTPSANLLLALRAVIADRDNLHGDIKATTEEGYGVRWRTFLAAFAAWEESHAPASSRLRKAVLTVVASQGPMGPFVRYSATEWPIAWKELCDALAAEPKVAVSCCTAGEEEFERLKKRTAELQARIDRLEATRSIWVAASERAELAEARVKELEGALRGAAKAACIHNWVHDKTAMPAQPQFVCTFCGLMKSEPANLCSSATEPAITITVAEFADAVAKLAKAVKP